MAGRGGLQGIWGNWGGGVNIFYRGRNARQGCYFAQTRSATAGSTSLQIKNRPIIGHTQKGRTLSTSGSLLWRTPARRPFPSLKALARRPPTPRARKRTSRSYCRSPFKEVFVCVCALLHDTLGVHPT